MSRPPHPSHEPSSSLFISFQQQDVQERELSLIREYETKLLALQEGYAAQDLLTSSSVSESLVRISHLLRQCLRSFQGEDIDPPRPPSVDEESRQPWTTSTASDQALEREIELARLEKENEELRRMLGLVPVQPRGSSSDRRLRLELPRWGSQRSTSVMRVGEATESVRPGWMYVQLNTVAD